MLARVLAGAGILVLAVSGVIASGLFAAEPALEGALAADTLSITVTEGGSWLPATGAGLGLLAGAGLLLAAVVLHLLSRRKQAVLVD